MSRKTEKIPKHVKTYLLKMTTDARIRSLLKNGDRREGDDVWKQIQYGGAEIIRNGYVFKYDEMDDTIISYSKKKHQPCFKISFSPEEKRILIDISYYSDCAHNKDLPASSGTLLMLKLIFEIILKHHTINNYTSISITDNSKVKQMTKDGKKFYYINLANMYYVSTGCTWYSSLAPMFLKNEIDYLEFIDDRKKIVGSESLSWNSLLANIPENPRGELKKLINITGIDKNEPESASKILNKIREAKTHSHIFYYFNNFFIKSFHVTSLTGKEWYIPIINGKIIAPNIENSCKNKKGWVVPDEYIKYISANQYNTLRKSLQNPFIQLNKLSIIKLD